MSIISVLILCALFVIGLFLLNNFLNKSTTKPKDQSSSPSFKIDDDGTIIRDCKEEKSNSKRHGDYCYKCGSKLTTRAKFCPNCGAPLT